MKSLAFALVCIFAAIAHADNASHYDTLKDMFTQATLPTLDQLNAGYAGRCYGARAIPEIGLTGPNDAIGSLLVGKYGKPETSVGDDGGPLFPANPPPPPPMRANLIITGSAGIHTRFDQWTLAQAIAFYQTNGIVSTPVSAEGKSLTWQSTYGDGTYVLEVRQSGSYIVGRAAFMTQGAAGAVTKVGEDYYCYFFQRLQ